MLSLGTGEARGPGALESLVEGLREFAKLSASCLCTARCAVRRGISETFWCGLEWKLRTIVMRACQLAQRVAILFLNDDPSNALASRLSFLLTLCYHQILPAHLQDAKLHLEAAPRAEQEWPYGQQHTFTDS